MRKKIVVLFTVALFFSLALATAQAATLEISPSIIPAPGSEDVTGLSTFTYDVFLTTGVSEVFEVAGWDFDMLFDTTELGNPTPGNIFGGAVSGTNPITAVNIPLNNVIFGAGTSTLLFDMTFDILSLELFDGVEDFWVVPFTGAKGFLSADFSSVLTPDIVNGADVGSPVPIPGAVVLLGSGLLGLVGLRRKFRQ